jgi:hypothetical protein
MTDYSPVTDPSSGAPKVAGRPLTGAKAARHSLHKASRRGEAKRRDSGWLR